MLGGSLDNSWYLLSSLPSKNMTKGCMKGDYRKTVLGFGICSSVTYSALTHQQCKTFLTAGLLVIKRIPHSNVAILTLIQLSNLCKVFIIQTEVINRSVLLYSSRVLGLWYSNDTLL